MRTHAGWMMVVAGIVGLALAPSVGAQDKVSGKVAETAFGKFKVDDGATPRWFSQSQKTSSYQPESWRPTVGDQVSLTYHMQPGKKGTAVVADETTLVKAGPNTITSLTSPQTVTILESGRSGVRTKLAGGQEIRFTLPRTVELLPAGWAMTAGEKAKVTFTIEKGRAGFGVNYVASKLEKAN